MLAGIEYNARFFLHCPLFHPIRSDLLGQLSYLPELDLSNIDPYIFIYIFHILNIFIQGTNSISILFYNLALLKLKYLINYCK